MIRFVLRSALVLGVVGGGLWVVAEGAAPFVPYARSAASRGSASGPVIADDRLQEISGCAVSQVNPGVVWVHNDSGDGPLVFALRISDGATLGVLRLTGVKAIDFEDMAIHAGRMAIGDIGDNAAARKNVNVYTVSEPKVDLVKTKQSWTLKPVNNAYTYAGGARDAEALILDPAGKVVIIDKSASGVWRPDANNVLQQIATLKASLVTGASLSADGRDVLVRTYPLVLRFRATGGIDTAWTAAARPVVSPLLPQAEAVCAGPGNTGFTISEARGRQVRLVPISW
jgi:hypothetical protein